MTTEELRKAMAMMNAAPRERMTQASFNRIKRYIQMRDEKPIRHSHDIINGAHSGTEWEAELRLSDIRSIICEIEKLRAALHNIAADCESDCPPSHGAIKYAARAALGGKDE